MNSSKKNSWPALAKVCALGTFAVCIGVCGFGQQSADDLFNQAVALFGQDKYEDACDLMTQVAQKRPNDERAQRFQKQYCAQKKLLLDSEKKYYEQGMKAAQSGSCDDARQDYERINKLSTKDPAYRTQLNGAVNACESKREDQVALDRALTQLRENKFAEARNTLAVLIQKGGAVGAEAQKQVTTLEQTERNRNQEAKDLFAQGKDEDARSRLTQVAADRGQASTDAQQLLRQISEVEANERKTVDQAEDFVKQGKNTEAQNLLDKVVARKGPLSAKAAGLLKQLAGTGEQLLRAGLEDYFRGDLDGAETKLTSYVSVNGPYDALAYFFRGATRASRYFLAGEADIHQKNDAVSDFQTVKQRHKDFRLPVKYVSPKIISLYQGAN